jgi:hypothetical protein
MLFTRQDRTFRVWFSVFDDTNQIVENIPPDDFDALIINATDTNSEALFITQSNEKLGLYRSDLPSSFLLANGVGDYCLFVSVIDPDSEITSSFTSQINVSIEDFDTLSGSIWNANKDLFDEQHTMGELLHSASLQEIEVEATVDIDTIVSGVWNAQTSSFVEEGSFGKTINKWDIVEQNIKEIYQIMGLELDSPMTVTTLQRTVAAITQSISGDPQDSVTVTRLP